MMTLVIVIVVLVILVAMIGSVYNSLVTLKNRFKNAFAQIDVQLKRRYDLIPNLVEAVKGYMAHEKDTLEAVIQARNTALSASNRASGDPGDPRAMKELMAAEGALTGTLGRLFALSESYPDLKANQNMLSLQEELSSTENRIAFSRQAFNDAVTLYNTRREVFPSNIIAGMFNFGPAELLMPIESESQRSAPRVAF